MKKNNILLSLWMIFSLSFPHLLPAQNNFVCGEGTMRQRLIEQHPEILRLEAGVEEYTQRFITDYMKKQSSRSTELQNDTIIIPLVFHIIQQGGLENIGDSQVVDEVRILNRDYNAQNADTADALWNFKPIIGNMHIEWRLANIDPFGNCTNGIDRIYSVQTYEGDDYSKLNSWPRQSYINVWLTSSIEGGVAAGYAYYPIDVATVYNIPAMDGVIILYNYIGSIGTIVSLPPPLSTSRALTHEIGHCFNLEHDWGNTNTCGVSCGTCGVPDIPETKGYCDCPNLYNDTSIIEICNPPIRENYQNYMEYSFCSVMFTQGQVARVMAALDTTIAQRNNLYTHVNDSITGVIDTPQKPCAPIAGFYPSTRYACLDGYVTFYNNSSNGTVNSYSWSFPNGAPSTSTDSIVKVQFLTAGWQPVTLTVTNSYGPPNTKTDNQLVYVGYNTALNVAPYFEGFDDPSVFSDPAQWASDNYDENQTYFAQCNYPHTGTGSAVLNNYFSTENHDIDEIISPPIDLTQLTQEQMNLSFYYSWASDNSNYNSNDDSIAVYASNDCGATWIILWEENAEAVLGYWQGYWTPSSESGVWQKVNIPLTNSNVYTELHKSNIRFKVRVFSSVGANNFYIDDFSVGFATYTGIEDISAISNVTLFPNPTNGQFNLDVQLVQAGRASVKVMDITGKEVIDAYEGQMNEGNNQMVLNSTEQLAKGVYIVYIEAGGSILQRKLVIQ